MMLSSSDLVDELLSKPVGRSVAKPRVEPDLTRQIEVNGNTATATIIDEPNTVNEGTARTFLVDEGLDPDEWEVTGFRKSEWGSADKPMESVRFTFKKTGLSGSSGDIPLDDLLAKLDAYKPASLTMDGTYGALVLIGDTQFGKEDQDGIEGTAYRAIDCINKARDRIIWLVQSGYEIGHVHVAWLGDHIEGFVSQGGDNAWRTKLTLTEQIRLTRRTMLHALLTFSELGTEKLTMVAVPGNHGEAVRFGKGVTRYDDSHDTESLIAVHDAVNLSPEGLDHVQFFVPENDELTVVTEVAGTVIAHAHGHQWKPGKHFDWWRGQAFNADSPLGDADLLVAGHLHHEFVDSDGKRQFVQVPAMESESTWFRHRTGTTGAPGLVLALTKDGLTDYKEVIR